MHVPWDLTRKIYQTALNLYYRDNTDMYGLHIAEDDGEVDTDFPSLDSKEPVSKFGFTKLALVEKEMASNTSKPNHIVTVYVYP